MGGLSLVLPFLRQAGVTPDMAHAVGDALAAPPDASATMDAQPAQAAQPAANPAPALPFLAAQAKQIQANTQAPDVAPDMSIGSPAQPPQPPPNPLADLAQAPQGATAQPGHDKGSFFREPGETKGHALLRILTAGAMGGLEGEASNAQTYAATGRNAGFGGGVYGAQTMPIQTALGQLQVQRGGLENQQLAQMLPFLRAQTVAGLYKTQSEIGKNTAEAGKATAEAGAIPTRQALETAQAEAANYKEDPNLGLIDLRTGKAVAGDSALAPLSDQEAAVLGKQTGDRVPLKLKNTANEMVNRGIKTVQANGRSLLVDNKGNTIKDMGQATPMAVINAQMTAPAVGPGGQLTDPNMEAVAQSVAAGKQDLATALRPYMRFPGRANALEARVLQINPDYYQGDYANRLKVLEKATQGSWADQKIAFNTAIQHADLLRQAAQAVNNGDIKFLNSINNKLATEFGDGDYTNLQAIANAYNHEITSVISKGHMTDSEVKSGAGTLPVDANFATIDKVLNSYKALAQSKMNMVNQQIDAGMKGTKGLNGANPSATTQANTPTPDTHIFSVKAWKAANPKGDVEAAKKAAQAQKYTVVE